jgi:hypothetical protein
MTQSNSDATGSDANEARLPRRDWILLPILGLLTIASVVASSELIARLMFPRSKGSIYDCALDKSIGMRGLPNAVCRGGNNRDTPSVEYRLNSCGNRAGMECGPRSAGAYRIVMIGSSTALGESVPMDKTIAGLLPQEISLRAARRVELYNEGMWSEIPNVIARNFKTFQTDQPDIILWLLTPHDILADSVVPPAQNSMKSTGRYNSATVVRTGLLSRTWRFVKESLLTKPLPTAVAELWQHVLDDYGTPPSITLLRHSLYESQSLYVQAALKQENDEGFLRTDLSPEWKKSLRAFDDDANELQAQANAAGIPLVVFLLPDRAQVAMISMGQWPSGFDPYQLDNELRATITSHGGTYVDILPDFRGLPDPEQYYFPVDGHPDARGHAIISGFLAKQLTSGAVPALKANPKPQEAPQKGR